MKKISICVTVIFIVAIGLVKNYFENDGSTIEKREIIVSSKIEDAEIISEILVDNSIISQIQKGNQNGFVVFKRKEDKYVYDSYAITSADVLKHLICVGNRYYYVLVCNKPQLERVKIVFYVPDSSCVIEQKDIKLNGNTMCITELPDSNNFSFEVTFYDTNGNVFK